MHSRAGSPPPTRMDVASAWRAPAASRRPHRRCLRLRDPDAPEGPGALDRKLDQVPHLPVAAAGHPARRIGTCRPSPARQAGQLPSEECGEGASGPNAGPRASPRGCPKCRRRDRQERGTSRHGCSKPGPVLADLVDQLRSIHRVLLETEDSSLGSRTRLLRSFRRPRSRAAFRLLSDIVDSSSETRAATR